MKITLVHNPSAGSGQSARDLVRLITDAGHEVRHQSSERKLEQLLRDPCDLIVAAGGDGTVARVLLAAADAQVPFAAIPIGTANNIAKTLGVLGDARELVETWSTPPRAERPFDIGTIVAPWGHYRFVEAVGGGPIAELIRRGEEVAADATLLGRETDRALHLLGELVLEAPVRYWKIDADGVDLSGEYIAVEVLNIRFVGPNLPLAPEADPSDGALDIVLVGEADRKPLLAYLENRLNLASGELPDLRVVRARSIEIIAPAGVQCHLDDQVWPLDQRLDNAAALSVSCLSGAATFVGTAEGPPRKLA